MKKNNLIVIARYNENLDWVKELKDDIIIYNKGSEFSYEFPRIDIPNVGRECETYVRAIIDNYELLKYYDSVTFLQGHPFDHCPFLYDMLNFNLDGKYLGLTKSFTRHDIPLKNEFLYSFEKPLYIFEKIIGFNKTQVNCEISYINTQDKRIANNELEELISVLYFIGIPFEGLSIYWATGAQYMVSTQHILNKSLNWWVDLLNFIHYCYLYLDWPTLGYVMERIWPIIWEHSNLKTKDD